jgi:hypothetical protein
MTRSERTAVCLLVILLFVGFVSGCSETDCTCADATGPTGQLVRSTGCKTGGTDADTSGVSSNQDCIEWEYDGSEHLVFTHVNAGLNCCPDFNAIIHVKGNTIRVVEDDEGLCDCYCLFDLEYEIHGLDPGVYELTVTEECLSEDDEPLQFTMDLLTSASGRHCVERTHYPWGH